MLGERTLIEVTKDDINVGHPCVSQYCPIALALCRIFKTVPATIINVSYNSIWIGRDRFHVSRTVRRFIKAFDRGYGKRPDPFKFFLRKELGSWEKM